MPFAPTAAPSTAAGAPSPAASATDTRVPPERRAIVIGASLAGLLAARVLSAHFEDVLLLERDDLGPAPVLRKGTPQTAHAHGLLARGVQGLEALLPGVAAELQAQGALAADAGTGVPFGTRGRRFCSTALGAAGLAVSRPLLEAAVRQRVLALPFVRLLCGVAATELLMADGRVCGVRLRHLGQTGPRGSGGIDDGFDSDDTAPAEIISAALVVDASGRGSRLPRWLQALGWPAPARDEIEVNVGYATAYFERQPGNLSGAGPDEPAGVALSATPDSPRSGVLLAQEAAPGGPPRWVLTLAGYDSDAPEPTLAALRQRATDSGLAELEHIAHTATLLGPVNGYRFARSQRHRYERLPRFPQGLLVIGDAIASFNPVYGQGMTVAICQAQALADELARGPAGLARRFFRRAAAIVDGPWQIAAGADLALAPVQALNAPPGRVQGLVNAYLLRVFDAATQDAAVANAFLRVAHMLAPPPSLFAPRLLWRVLRHAWRPHPAKPTPHPRTGPRHPPEATHGLHNAP